MDELFLSYLSLLRELGSNLDQLSELAQQKMARVRENDLIGLDEVLKQEQVLALALRGLDQRRLKLLGELGLSGVPLSGLVAQYPAHLQDQAAQTVDSVRQSYQIFRSYADAARSTLELNLHEIDKIVTASGVETAGTGAGYEAPGAEPPKNMKTDFRA